MEPLTGGTGIRPSDLQEIYTFAGLLTHGLHMRPVPLATFPMGGTQQEIHVIMKTNPLHLLFALAAAVTASAQESKPPVDRRPPPQPLLVALDGDRDGKLSPDEIAGSPAALLKLDKNADGMLSRKEIHPPPPKKPASVMAPPPRKAPPPLLKALDLDKDGTLSADEIEDAPLSLATLDKDEDGTLSRRELDPPKPPRKATEQDLP